MENTIPIRCEGVELDDKTIKYAQGHSTIRLVKSFNKTQITRCTACQKLYRRLRSQRRVASPEPEETQPEIQILLDRCKELVPHASGVDKRTITSFMADFKQPKRS